MRQRIADELLAMLGEGPLDDVTVRELTRRLGISRQAFYYHFHDIYEVVEWIYESASQMILRSFTNLDGWLSGYVLMLNWIQANRTLVLACCRGVRKDYVENFMNRVLYAYIDQVVHEESEGMRVTEQQKAFITRFYTFAINDISLEWIMDGMRESPTQMTRQLDVITRGDLKRALQRFERENKAVEQL